MLTVDYDRLGLRPGHRLLDVGAGAGRHAFEGVRRGAEVVAVDIDDVSLKEAKTLLDGVATDVEGTGSCARASVLELPFADASFDRVIAAEVLEHVGDDAGALAELARVTRPGGMVAATVPRWFPERVCWALSESYHAPAVPGGHVRVYRESQLRSRLRGAGFRTVDRHHAHGLHTPYWWLRCLVGVGRDDHPAVRAYHRLLVREIIDPSPGLRLAERALQPTLGKSVVLYAVRESA